MSEISLLVNVEGELKKVVVKMEATTYKPEGLELTEDILKQIREASERKPLSVTKADWDKIRKGSYPLSFSIGAKHV